MLQGLSVKSVRGDAVLFYALHPNGTTDLTSEHGSCPTLKVHLPSGWKECAERLPGSSCSVIGCAAHHQGRRKQTSILSLLQSCARMAARLGPIPIVRLCSAGREVVFHKMDPCLIAAGRRGGWR